MITSPTFAGKRYAVLGLARSGLSAVETLLASGAHVTAWDAREEPRQLIADRVALIDPANGDLTGCDGIVVSPGVPLNRHPIAEVAAQAGVPVIGDIELFALVRPSLPPHRVVGITGTNGKSTTTALIHHIIEGAGIPARMGGNIGMPVLSEDPLPAGGVYVLELSSYQLDLTYSLDCDVAVLTNITPDHLDRYDDFDDYAAAKARLFAMQSESHSAIVMLGDAASAGIASRARAKVTGIPDDDACVRSGDWPALQGPHNARNAACAIAVCKTLGVAEDTVERGLRSFAGLPHRMERVAEANGVTFINDSKATNPASTAPALAAFPPEHGRPRIHWIVGGLPKGESLDECAPWFGHVAAAYIIGEAGPLFAELLAAHMPVVRSEMMAEAIRQAIEAARPGDVVLLSPACASFDQFRDFEARGDAFRKIVDAYLAAPCGTGDR